MTRTRSSAIALALAALLAGPAMAANTDGPVTRDQVKAELAEAKRTGNVITGESSVRLNEMFPHNYPAQHNAATATREQIKAELAEAVRTGNIVRGESGARLNEVFPHNYAAQQSVASKTREQVKTELAEARGNGWLNRHIEA